jgi:hypothetical protein
VGNGFQGHDGANGYPQGQCTGAPTHVIVCLLAPCSLSVCINPDLCFDQQACSCTAVPVPCDLLYLSLSLKSRSHSSHVLHRDGACWSGYSCCQLSASVCDIVINSLPVQ